MPDLIEKRYHDEGEWVIIDPAAARYHLESHCIDVDQLLNDLRDGRVVNTGFALYRIRPKGAPDA